MTSVPTSNYVDAAKLPAHNPTGGFKPQTVALPAKRGTVTFPRPVPRLCANSISMSSDGHTRATLFGWCIKIAGTSFDAEGADSRQALKRALRAEAHRRWPNTPSGILISSLQLDRTKFPTRAHVAEFWNTAMINAGFLSRRVIDLHSN